MDSIFFILSKLGTILLYPLPVFFLLALLLIFKTKSGHGKYRLFQIILFLYLASNAFISNFLVQTLEKDYPPVNIAELPKSDVAIVLGGMIQTISAHPGRPELSDSADRLTDAVRMYKAGKVKKILFTGGSGLLFANTYREADLAKELFLDLGVPEKDLIWENNSRNTYENAVETKKILQDKKIESAILVTSAFHMKRAAGCFQKQSISFVVYPTDYRATDLQSGAFELYIPSAGFLDQTSMAIKEWVGYFVYRAKSYL
ncbi:YdcF family protein [Leptospira kanakyensis]|uniref:YdcF family protein n=1 Tax=Leptospira kanakyensis TaxID=2484968 RepID=A0A6N4PSX6_9LEPT|nr:YdcF family protein [Leptospira kanakyensis]MCW7480858.1 YdcF family protein [Leptospira kanakyensis]TGK47660.1 YdcF family protein [Leptospira kanakyensis]TGK63337.1 YdcF family protein [Leptospira kanakyensis]TGK66944.1 YdcF family protein [Leptospira kanakyensis]